MRGQAKAQLGIDFLVGMVIFLGALIFVFQFLSATVLPFAQSADEEVVTVNRMADSLYYDKMATGEKGVIDLTYLYDEGEGELKGEEELLRDLNVGASDHNINITVVDEGGIDRSDDEVVRINESGLVGIGGSGSGKQVRIGRSALRGSINRVTRVGYVERTAGVKPRTVVVKIRMW
jgi:hypothetical protein